MPEKEAINFLKDALIEMAQNTEDIDTPRHYFFMLAISALERRVPRKVDTHGTLYGERDFCPVCGCVIENCHAYFCIRCGQALKEDKEKEKT